MAGILFVFKHLKLESERIVMRNRINHLVEKKLVFIIFFFFIWFFIAYSSPQEVRRSDEWEVPHNSIQPPEKVMQSIGVKPGMFIGEIGAGRGRYAVKLAEKVGNEGKIYANDILERKLKYLEHRCKRDNISNIVTILGETIDPFFPTNSLDMAFMINTYHHLEKPVKLLKNTIPALKPNATLVIVEHDPKKVPGYGSHSTRKGILLKQADEAGFELVRIETFLPRDNIYIFRIKKTGSLK